jgi:hypothetical protein
LRFTSRSKNLRSYLGWYYRGIWYFFIEENK